MSNMFAAGYGNGGDPVVAASAAAATPSALPPRRSTAGSGLPTLSTQGAADGDGGREGATRSSIQVAVRLRPLSDKERQRGDRVGWGADQDGNVGTVDPAGNLAPKHRFDTVFGPDSDNARVAQCLALPLVGPALAGVNGTIFAYGVTSSGKTHTMMGTDEDPGIVPRVVHELFAEIARQQRQQAGSGEPRVFSVRMSMMEIYNEVLNDLLDPSRANLKVREDARSGLVEVEGLTEQQVLTAEQALDIMTRGDTNRKVGATAFNEDSSRSHTITRIVVESSTAAAAAAAGAPAAAPRGGGKGRRTVSVLSLIDLAGSESARATLNKGQRMEGAFINRSLLTLGTVIHKLAAGGGGHVPFRDSKLTRLLQPSLSGPGARVAVVCNVTPAMAQAEETANTLKFASRAKLVQVIARTNEVLDERALLKRYQKEVADLKRQLAEARRLLAAAGVNFNPSGLGGGDSGGGGGGDGGRGADSTVRVSGVGLLTAEGVVAAVEAERGARQMAEAEATMLRIKVERLQAYVDASMGASATDLEQPSPAPELAPPPPAGFLRRPSTGAPSATRLPAGPATAPGSASGAGPAAAAGAGSEAARASLSGGSFLRHAASSPRLQTPGAEEDGGSAGSGARPTLGRRGSRIPGPSGEASKRVSYCGVSPSAAGAAAAASADDGVEVTSSRTSVTTPDAVDLRNQVAAALSAGGARAAGGGGAAAQGVHSAASAAASGRATDFTGSEGDYAEDELNEGLMAQLQDMISEVQLPNGANDQPSAAHARGAAPSGGHTPGTSTPPPARPLGSTGARPGSAAASRRGGGGGGALDASVASSVTSLRRSTTMSAGSSYGDPDGEGDGDEDRDRDLELQVLVLHADREVLHDQLVASEQDNERLTGQVTDLKRQLHTYEELTKQAAAELADIRLLKEQVHGRLQRENAALRAQLAAAGLAPVTHLHLRASGRESRNGFSSPPSPPRMGHMQQQQQPLQQHGASSLAAFGSPAPVAHGGMSAAQQARAGGAAGSPGLPRPQPSSTGTPPSGTAGHAPNPFAQQQQQQGGAGGVSSRGAGGAGGEPGTLQEMPSLAGCLPAAVVQGAQQGQGGEAASQAALLAKLQQMEGVVKGLMQDREHAARLQAEHDRLRQLLRHHGIQPPE